MAPCAATTLVLAIALSAGLSAGLSLAVSAATGQTAATKPTTVPAARPTTGASTVPAARSTTKATTKPAGPSTNPYESAAVLTSDNEIDRLILARLDQLGIKPAKVCSDAVFIRRVYLDVIGALPTTQETRDFLASREPDKRSALIDRLLARDEFTDYWAMKWGDVLRVKSEFPINLWPNAAQGYHRWIRTSIKENKSYDRFVREMLTASGSNFRVPEVNFYRAIQSRKSDAIARAVALTFMGARAEKWPKERLAAMAAIFSQVGFKYTGEWKEEIVFFDIAKAASQPAGASSQPAAFPDGTHALLAAGRDPREAFADWLIDARNPWFAECVVNRIWCWLLGRGIIHEPDDIRPDNPPSNPAVLACLERELIASHYDLKHIYRLILNSKTYQLSSIPTTDRPEAAANFAHYPLRRMEAEVLMDALCQITGTTERYSSAVPEPFTYIPENQRSIELPDGSITSSFLEMFGRPERDTGLESERNNRPSAAQRLYMLNSSHIQGKLEQGRKLQALLRARNGFPDTVTELYLTILSRYPTDAEMRTAEDYARSGTAKGREASIDVAWALINSAEFLYRH